jgi:hypothetical protein
MPVFPGRLFRSVLRVDHGRWDQTVADLRHLAPSKSPQQLKPIKLMVPDYLFRELTIQAADRGVTKKYLILKALQDAGYALASDDLEEDGRRLNIHAEPTRTSF